MRRFHLYKNQMKNPAPILSIEEHHERDAEEVARDKMSELLSSCEWGDVFTLAEEMEWHGKEQTKIAPFARWLIENDLADGGLCIQLIWYNGRLV